MYCIKCGAKLADTEKKCPLCLTAVYHPDLPRQSAEELYPKDKMPRTTSKRAVLGGAILFLFMIPLVICFFADTWPDKRLDWFGYALGGIAVAYLVLAFPVWFKKRHPIILLPCDFAASILYVWYISYATGGEWFWTFALPVALGVAVILCGTVTLLRSLKRGKLYVLGGAIILFGGWMVLMEWLMELTFGIPFIGWSMYPFITLAFLGGMLLYLAMNSIAREKLERKLFF